MLPSYSSEDLLGEVTQQPEVWAELVRRGQGKIFTHLKIPANNVPQVQRGREDLQLQLPVHQHEVPAAEQDPAQDGRPQPGPRADARLW